MKLTPDTMARIRATAVANEALTKINGIISIDGYGCRSMVHMTDEAFLDTFDTYSREKFLGEHDKISAVEGNTEFFALVMTPND